MSTTDAQIVYAVTIQDIQSAICRRLGPQATTGLSAEDILLAAEEVKAALEHHLDIREYINIGLDAWEITRQL
jgi:hypothetical protein